jgi:hypothetical protein
MEGRKMNELQLIEKAFLYILAGGFFLTASSGVLSVLFGRSFITYISIGSTGSKIARIFFGKKRMSANTSVIPAGTGPVFTGMLMVFFGVFGLLFHTWLTLSLKTTFLYSLGAAMISTYFFAKIVLLYITGCEADEMKNAEVIGSAARVSISIPKDGVGQIAYVADLKRVILPARGAFGKAISKSSDVVIVNVSDNTFIVDEF